MRKIFKTAAIKSLFKKNTDKAGKTISTTVEIQTDNESMTLPKNHPIAKAVNVNNSPMREKHVDQLLQDAHLFTEGDQILDFRTSDAKYVMSQDTLNEFVDVLGAETVTSGKQKGQLRAFRPSKEMLINIDGHDDPEEMNVTGRITYSPFEEDVNIDYELIRLICANGMTTTHKLLNRFAPVINLPITNMDTVFHQMDNSLNNFFHKRLNEMKHQFVSMHDMNVLYQMVQNRVRDGLVSPLVQRTMNRVNVNMNLGYQEIYQQDVFEDKSLLKSVPSNITEYEYLNLITQVVSHSKGPEYSDVEMNMLASSVLHDGTDLKKIQQMTNVPLMIEESDTENAFFGTIAAA